VYLLASPVFFDHGKAGKHRIFLIRGVATTPLGIRLLPSTLVESDLLPFGTEVMVIVKSVSLLRQFGLADELRINFVKKAKTLR
jgi:hypothetical protein